MIYRDFGKTGLRVSAIGMGCEYVWTADEKQVYDLVRAAVEAGINYFDLFVGTPATREYYGKALKGIRDKVCLAGHLGCIDVLMFPVNPLFNLLPQDTADARMKGREVKAMTEEEKAAYPSKQELYELCGKQGVPIVAMKPFAAGNILKNHEEGRLKGLLSLTPVQSISYVLSFPQVACPVPGFANVDELNQSLAYLTAGEEEKDFSEIQESLVGQFANQCMYCNHCQPCPKKIDIAEGTKLADMAEKEMTDELRERYAALLVTGEDCIHCGSCTRRCPFGIDASENMRRAQKIFGC